MNHPHLPFTRRARTGLAIVVAALLVVLLAIYAFIPPVREFASGPSADAVAAQRASARAEDLAGQNKALEQKLMDTSADKSKEIADLTAALADNKAQLADAITKLSAPDENAAKAAQAGVDKARADSLKKQYDALQADADRKIAAKSADAATSQARANDLKKQIDALQYVPPVTASTDRAGIIAARKQFGIYTTQSPFQNSEYDLIERSLNRDAQVTGFFADMTHPFRSDAVRTAWSRNEIPLLTLETQEQVGNVGPEQPAYSLKNIYGGNFDGFLRQYARDIKTTGLPLILRLNQEMNGTFYPWSEIQGWDGKSINGNKPGDYAKMWQHIHDVFEQEGANDLVVWMWAPNRINRIPSQPLPAQFYPGDDYVDLVGLDAYRRPTDGDEAPTFNGTYGATLPYLRAFNKPIWIAETGATDALDDKVKWTRDVFAALSLPENADIAGVMNFAITVTGTQGTNNWSWTSQPKVMTAAREGLAASGFGRPIGEASAEQPVEVALAPDGTPAGPAPE